MSIFNPFNESSSGNIFGYPSTPSSSQHGANSQTFVIVQAQDSSGNWVGRSQASSSSPGSVRDLMEQMKRQYPSSRIRAIDSVTGSLYDMLP